MPDIATTILQCLCISFFSPCSLTGILCVVGSGSVLQFVFAVSIMLYFIRLYNKYHPYEEEFIGEVKSLTQWQIYTVFFIGLLLKTEALHARAYNIILEIILVCALLVNLLWDPVASATDTAKSRSSNSFSENDTSNPLFSFRSRKSSDSRSQCFSDDVVGGVKMVVRKSGPCEAVEETC